MHVDENIKNKAEQFKREGYKNFERVKVLDITPRINEVVKRLIGFDATGYQIYSNTDTSQTSHGEIPFLRRPKRTLIMYLLLTLLYQTIYKLKNKCFKVILRFH